MSDKSINLQIIKSFNPCEEGLENFIKHHKDFSGSPLELLELENVPVSDKFWLLLRNEFIPENDLHELACKFAESVLHLFEEEYPDDKRPRKAIEAKKKFIKGEISEKEVYAAGDAAWAARAAAWDDASAAGDAARAAAWNAAGDASAARAAVRAAAGAAAGAAEEQKQLQIVKKYFEQIGETE
jgi:hypothetical protein